MTSRRSSGCTAIPGLQHLRPDQLVGAHIPDHSDRGLAIYPAYWLGRWLTTARTGTSTRSAPNAGPARKSRWFHGRPRKSLIQAEVRVAIEPGDLLCFSGAQLHGGVPNRTDLARSASKPAPWTSRLRDRSRRGKPRRCRATDRPGVVSPNIRRRAICERSRHVSVETERVAHGRLTK